MTLGFYNLRNKSLLAHFVKPSRIITRFVKRLFAKKTLILISKGKIRNFEISSLTQVGVCVLSIFIANLFYRSTIYNETINDKSNKISNLQEANDKFQRELTVINSNLEKINGYFMTVANYEEDIDSTQQNGLHNKDFNLLIAELNLEENYKKTAIEIASANVILDKIKFLAKKRISDLEQKITATGISLNEDRINSNDNSLYDSSLVALSLNTEDELSQQGGPFEAVSGESNDFDKAINLGTVDMNDEINYLSNLEQFIYHAPLAKPMEDYYVSSGFGRRNDPIKKVRAKHNGMDFVGDNKNEKVLSPSVGEVKFAGNFGAYGKTVVIDHGYGITTRYGHLSKIKVEKGDIVKRGDVIALQGNSGRSTGSHLHYEVRYNSAPLNPRKFLKAGNSLFKADDI